MQPSASTLITFPFSLPGGKFAKAIPVMRNELQRLAVHAPIELSYLSDAELCQRQAHLSRGEAERVLTELAEHHAQDHSRVVKFDKSLAGYTGYKTVQGALPQLRLVETLVSSYLHHSRTFFEIMAKASIALNKATSRKAWARCGGPAGAYKALASGASRMGEMLDLRDWRGVSTHERHYHAFVESNGHQFHVLYSTALAKKPLKDPPAVAFSSFDLLRVQVALNDVKSYFVEQTLKELAAH